MLIKKIGVNYNEQNSKAGCNYNSRIVEYFDNEKLE